MYHFYLVPLFSAILNGVLVALVLFANPRRRLNRIFCFSGIAIVYWNIVVYILARIHAPAESLFWFRQGMAAATLVPAIMYHTAVELSGKEKRQYIIAGYIVAGLFVISLFTPLGTNSGRVFGTVYRVTGGPSMWALYVCVTICGCCTIYTLRSASASNSTQGRSARLIAIASSVLYLGILHDGAHILGLDYYPGTKVAILSYGTVCSALYGFIVGYAILSYQFLDFRVAIGRNVAHALRVFFLLGVAYLLLLCANGLYPGLFAAPAVFVALAIIFTSVFIATALFPKLFGNFSESIGSRVVGDKFEYQDKILISVTRPNPTTHFQNYIEQIADLIFAQMSVSRVGIAVFDGDPQTSARAVRPVRLPAWSIFAHEDLLRKNFIHSPLRPFDIRETSSSTEGRLLRDAMRADSLMLALPISADHKQIFGVLAVGSRPNGEPLSIRDSEVLASVCRHIAIRIERLAVARNEELQRANQAKDQFLASINHEIRNPLNGIHGIVQMLKEHCPPGRAQYFLGTLQSCTDQLRTTMDDVLDFNRLGSEVADNHPVQADLVELVRSITSSYDLAGDKLIMEPVCRSLATPGSAEHTIPVWCDSGKFSHILMNYLSNALKYGVPSGARVRIEGEAIDGGKARVKLTVASTGPTLSKEEVLSLFSPLTRGQRARDTKAHGLGLGLALCKKLAQAIGGNVGVESADAETIFWFVAELPVANPANPQVPQPAFHITPRLALAIEDEPYNRLVLGYHLNRFGITPIWAVDGQSALAAAEDRPFDLIVMDWVLPDMDGEILLSKLREISPSPLPPVVVVSAYSTDSKRAAGLAAGAVAFVTKPIDEAKLAEALGECKLGPPITWSTTEGSEPERIDLAPLKQASADPGVVLSFLSGAEEVYTKLTANWEKNPHAAAASAHKLKGQMLLIRAKDCADLLDLLERALVDGRHPDDIERLMDAARHSFEGVTRSIRAAERLASPNT